MQIKEYSIEELQEIRKRFVKEYIEANQGAKTSLAFAKNQIKLNENEDEEKQQVIIIGGSNLASALVEKKNGHVEILEQVNKELPVFKTREIFFQFILEHLSPDINRVGLNFAYPMDAVYRGSKLDGKLLKGTKEHSFIGLVGNNVGEGLENYILEKTGRKIDFVVANDTVCLVLSGLEKDDSACLVGGVVGTGYNFGMFLDDNIIVNLESGNFNNFDQTESGIFIDKNSIYPGHNIWEKEISGAYLFQHYNYYIKQNDSGQELSSSVELSNLAESDNDNHSLARKIFERAGSLVAAQIASIYDYKKNQALTVIIEGSLYWKGYNFLNFVNIYLEKLRIKCDDIKIEFIENSSVLGAARLIM